MRKHSTLRTASSAAMLPIAGVVLAAATAALLTGCTASGTTSASPTAAATTPTATSPSQTPTASSTFTAPGSTSGVQSTPTCTGTQLSLSTSPDSGAGLFDYIVLEFVNAGSATCTVEGYPGAAAWGVTDINPIFNATRQLTGNVGDQYTSPAPITLAHGATASTILEWIDKPTNGHPYADCLRRGAGSFGITAPNTTQTTHISLPADVCSAMLVHPLVPDATGRQ